VFVTAGSKVEVGHQVDATEATFWPAPVIRRRDALRNRALSWETALTRGHCGALRRDNEEAFWHRNISAKLSGAECGNHNSLVVCDDEEELGNI
jgi:hypothetical protein